MIYILVLSGHLITIPYFRHTTFNTCIYKDLLIECELRFINKCIFWNNLLLFVTHKLSYNNFHLVFIFIYTSSSDPLYERQTRYQISSENKRDISNLLKRKISYWLKKESYKSNKYTNVYIYDQHKRRRRIRRLDLAAGIYLGLCMFWST